VIAVDTNILVYAHVEESPLHEPAKQKLVELARGRDRWAIPVFCLGEFLRVVTHPRLFRSPYSPAEACRALSRVLESPSLVVLHPGERYVALLMETVEMSSVKGNLIFDAMVVALCRESGATTLLTEDRDFDRFKEIKSTRLQ
jgi:toxin-antitoxin system PIN domain toxin